jgi:hypothetical protein
MEMAAIPLIPTRSWSPSHPPTSGPIRVLALDGAAGDSLRGYAQIKVIRALMQMIWEKTHPRQPIVESEVDAMRPCDHFVSVNGFLSDDSLKETNSSD